MRARTLRDLVRASNRSPLRRVAALAAVTLASALGAAPAQAKSLSVLDPAADSGGQIVVDAAGNGYVAWLHHGSPDAVMFCKLSTAGACKSAVTLPAPAASPSNAQPDQPFALLAATTDVFVVDPRSVPGDVVYWLSTDGGQTFGAPVDITAAGDFTADTTVADILLDPSEPSLTATPPVANFDIASTTPGLGYSWVPSNLTPGASQTSFSFTTPSTGTVGTAALGEQPNGYPLEAFSTIGTGALGSPDTVYFVRQTAAAALGSPLSSAWTANATLVGPGYLPVLAGGPKGLFLAYESYATEGLTGAPSSLLVEPYDQASGTFSTGPSIADDQPQQTAAMEAGAINENATTGELAVVWPKLVGSKTVMRLWTSKNGGATFKGPVTIATIASGYGGTASLALNAKGGGLVAFRTSSGLQLTNLASLAKPKPKKHKHKH